MIGAWLDGPAPRARYLDHRLACSCGAGYGSIVSGRPVHHCRVVLIFILHRVSSKLFLACTTYHGSPQLPRSTNHVSRHVSGLPGASLLTHVRQASKPAPLLLTPRVKTIGTGMAWHPSLASAVALFGSIVQ